MSTMRKISMCTTMPVHKEPMPQAMQIVAAGLIEREKIWSSVGFNPVEIPVYFMDRDPDMIRFFRVGIDKWEDTCNIVFPITDIQGNAKCRVTFHPNKGHWSYVGTDNLRINPDLPTLNLAFNQRGANLHELGHCAGFAHEHANPFNPVPWDLETLYEYYRTTQGWTKEMTYSQVVQVLDTERIIATGRDMNSIMHYSVDESLTIGDYAVGWNYDFSAGDLLFFPSIYPFKKPDEGEDFDIVGLFREMFPTHRHLCNVRKDSLVVIANRLGIRTDGLSRGILRLSIKEVLDNIKWEETRLF